MRLEKIQFKSSGQECPLHTDTLQLGGQMRTRARFAMWVVAVALPAVLWAADSGTPRDIDVQKPVMTLRVSKAGLFSAFGHEHEISAPIQQGRFSESDRSVNLTVDARQMRVMDKDVSGKDRAEIQETMLGPKVLDSNQFPEIRFRSTIVEGNRDPFSKVDRPAAL